MKNTTLLLLMLFAFQIADAQTTISVGTGTPVLDGVLAPGEWNATSITTSLGVTLNAMADGQYLYMSAQWNDTTESIAKNRLTYNGSTWVRSGDEDRIAFIFDMGRNGTDGANCATMCHIPVMSTTGGKVDLWHWKSVRSNPMGFVDDNYIDSLNRQGDPGTSAAVDNVLLSSGRPSFMSISDPHANVDFLTRDSAAFSSFDPFGVMAPHTYNRSVTFDSLAAFSNGDFVSGYLLRVSLGDRASVLAAGKRNNGVWTVEFKKPYAGTNFDFAVVPGASTTFTYEIFDNEGSTHWTNGLDATILTLDFSGLTNVENQNNKLPAGYALGQNYPNPFNPSTKIDFSVLKTRFVSIDVFNVIGEKVTSLVNKELHAGNYSVDFNAVNMNSGIYFYKMTSGNFTETKKMLLLK